MVRDRKLSVTKYLSFVREALVKEDGGTVWTFLPSVSSQFPSDGTSFHID